MNKAFSVFANVSTLLCLMVFCNSISAVQSVCLAQDAGYTTLSKKILEEKTSQGFYCQLETAKSEFFKDNKFTEFVEFVKPLAVRNKKLQPFVDYYIGLSRYRQLKYLEEKQLWDEYFSQGNDYREELEVNLERVLNATSVNEPIHLYARLILWQYHQDQQDVFSFQTLSDLANDAVAYGKDAKDAVPLKDVADAFLVYQEKAKAKQLYKLYVEKTIGAETKDEELYALAADFYKKQNLELSELIFDAYVERAKKTMPKEKFVAALVDITKLFSYKTEGSKDMVYAEKIFQQISDAAGQEAFDEALLYERAFNVEKAKEYTDACRYYIELVQRFPQSPHADEAHFKIGIIKCYVESDINTAKQYFEKLTRKEQINAHVISSWYQLGLLSQWENELEKARKYYNALTEKARDNFTETVALAKNRMKEIEEASPLEYNLKMFLDLSLNEKDALHNMGKVELNASSYILKKEEEVDITSSTFTGETGCMHVELQYLWSGHLGKATPTLEQSSFSTSYAHAGTKEINLVVVSASGVIDRSLDLVDVY